MQGGVKKANKTSTYFFIGKLSDHTAQYQIQREALLDDFRLDVFLDGISIYGSTDKNFDDVLKEVRDTFNIIVAAFVFKTKKRLSYTLDNWVEAKEVFVKENEIGWIVPPTRKIVLSKERSKINSPWKKAAWLYRNLSKGNNNHKLALKDYWQAMQDTSDDAFLFAYRAIEDICRAVTGKDDINEKTWKQMHTTLNTSKSQIDPLTTVAEKVRHGDLTNKVVLTARKNRETYLDISHQILSEELHRTFSKFI